MTMFDKTNTLRLGRQEHSRYRKDHAEQRQNAPCSLNPARQNQDQNMRVDCTSNVHGAQQQ